MYKFRTPQTWCVEHNPFTKNNEEVHVLLFEKQSTAHTGKVQHEKTQILYPKI